MSNFPNRTCFHTFFTEYLFHKSPLLNCSVSVQIEELLMKKLLSVIWKCWARRQNRQAGRSIDWMRHSPVTLGHTVL